MESLGTALLVLAAVVVPLLLAYWLLGRTARRWSRVDAHRAREKMKP